MSGAADRHLLFGLLALQNGIINQVQLVAAFQAWTLDKTRSLADHLEARGDLSGARRALLDALAKVHLEAHGGDVEKSLAAVSAGRSTRESLVRIGDPDIEATFGHVPSAHGSTGDGGPDRTASYAIGSTTSDGQRFRVLRPHARGGLGAVFVAIDAELNREVALKQILDHHADDPTSRQRFLIEAEITGGLEHPGIVPVYGLGTYGNGRPYYAMRFIRGDSLKEAIELFHGEVARKGDAGQRSLELRRLLGRLTDVCNAIDYAHSRGVLHRDLKPANIIVGKYGETLVVDWGLAKPLGRVEPGGDLQERMLVPSSASGSANTLPGSAMGTPAYMSPEQARGELDRLGPRSDVYSLGATLYCLLTGKPAFAGEDVGAVLRAVQRGDFPTPCKLDPTIDRALEAICLRAMSLRPEDRYESCNALADDIERWLADESVLAWKEPWNRKLVRWLTRHRTAVTAAGAAMVMAVVGLGAVSGVQARANGELKRSYDALSAANARVVQVNLQLEAANENVTRANDELKAANVREHERFDLAMEAIKLFHGDISKDLLLKQKEFETLRVKLLRGAADFYGKLEGLLEKRQDRESRVALGRAYEELARLTFSIGDSPRALAVFRKAVDVRRALSDEPDADDAIKLDLARTLSSNGELLEGIGNRAAAMAAYEEALAMVKRLKPVDAVTEPVFRVEGRVSQNIGWLYHLMGQEETSVVWLRKACEILEKGIASSPGRPGSHPDRDSRALLGATLNALSGPLGALRRSSETLADQYRALELQRKLALETPEDPTILYHVALTQFDIGGSLRDMGRVSEAFSAYREGTNILERLISDSPAIIEFRRLQARCLNGCGDSARELGHASEALTYFREALGAWKRVADANPARYADGLEVGISRNRIGWLLFGMGRNEEAIKEYEAAQAVYQKVVDSFPPQDVHRTRSEVANVMINLAEIHRRQKRLAEARKLCDQAIAILETLSKEYPGILDYRARVGECLLRSGQVRLAAGDTPGAAADWRRAVRVNQDLPPRKGEEAMFEAGCHAMLSAVAGATGSGVSASDGLSEAEKAMAILSRILAEGYHAPEIANESCLEPLRGRADFQLVMLDMAFPAEPFAR